MDNTKLSVFGHYKKAIGKKLTLIFFIDAILFCIATAILNVVVPVYYKEIIDGITSGLSFDVLLGSLKACAYATLLYLIFDRLSEHIDIYFAVEGRKNIEKYAMETPLDHSYGFFTNTFAGALVNKQKKFAGAFFTITDLIYRDFLYAVIVVIGVCGMLFYYSRPLGWLSLGLFLIFFTAVVFFTKIRLPYERKRGIIESKTAGILADIVTNVFTIKYFSSKKREVEYFDKSLELVKNARNAAWGRASWSYTAIGIIINASKLILLLASIYLWSKGEVSSGTIVLVLSYGINLFNKLGGLGSAMRRFAESYLDAKEFVDVLNVPIEIKDPLNPITPNIKNGEIKFDKVSFAYNSNGNHVIDNLSLTIPPKQKVGIVGSSGAGKTTLTKLILRFVDITSGNIYIDSQNISSLSQDDLRSVISYVPQDPILFHRTLRENIAYGKPNASEEEIIDASKKAHAHEFIMKLEKGYETMVGERGVKLSGGERQRVAIARAILKDSPILVLDEATSSLDSESEHYIQQALVELMKEKTAIVIAHRLSTISKLDRIIVMSNGNVIEDGTHGELLESKGSYYELWQHQSGGFIADVE